jgi:hypothetical protein
MEFSGGTKKSVDFLSIVYILASRMKYIFTGYFPKQKPGQLFTEHIRPSVKVTKVKNPMNKKSTYEVAATMMVTIDDQGENDPRTALENKIAYNANLREVKVTAFVKVDEHKDLPLVNFRYPSSDSPGSNPIREVRVTKKNDEYLEGFEGDRFKKFRVDRMLSAIHLVEIPAKE